MFKWSGIAVVLGVICLAVVAMASSDELPLDHEAIDYANGPVNDAVSALQQRIDKGEVKLNYESGFGYLRSVLEGLNVSTASQVLVFSKTSFQAPLIVPRTPRALYYRDNVAVGFVRTGDVLEFAAVDKAQGVQFYTLNQEQIQQKTGASHKVRATANASVKRQPAQAKAKAAVR